MFERISHVALRVADVDEAEAYYSRLFSLRVAFRDLRADGEWFSLRPQYTWADAGKIGYQPRLSALARDQFVLALEESEAADGGTNLDHIGIDLDQSDLDDLSARLASEGCTVEVQRPGLVVFVDRYGTRWECSTSRRSLDESSTGARTGRWLPSGESPLA